MEITEEDVRQFRILCLKSHGVDLSPDEARETIARLTLLYGRMDEWVQKQSSDQPPHTH